MRDSAYSPHTQPSLHVRERPRCRLASFPGPRSELKITAGPRPFSVQFSTMATQNLIMIVSNCTDGQSKFHFGQPNLKSYLQPCRFIRLHEGKAVSCNQKRCRPGNEVRCRLGIVMGVFPREAELDNKIQ